MAKKETKREPTAEFKAAEKVGLEFNIPASGQITSPYGIRFHPVLKTNKMHTGIDIGARPHGKETPILAAEDGVISYVGAKGGYGNTVIIKHGNGYETMYAHLADGFRKFAQVGQEVRQGNTVGIMGTTGRSTGVHLHFEIRKDGKHLDPADFYPDVRVVDKAFVKPMPDSRSNRKETAFLQKENAIDENAKMATLDGSTADGKAQIELLKQRGVAVDKYFSKMTQDAAAYAFSKRDSFAALTFLSEGVDGRAFYHDPATKDGKIHINMHAGITMTYQSPSERRKVLEAAGLEHLEGTVTRAINANKGVPAELKGYTVSLKQIHNMFEVVRDKYTDVAEAAVLREVGKNPLAQKMMKEDKLTQKEAAEAIINEMPSGTWAVLQHAAYKKGNLNSFGKVIQSAINATLDEKNSDRHLAEGASHIQYVFRNKQGKMVHDTRVETLHRVVYAAGDDLDPATQIKLATGKPLENADKAVEKVLKRANVPDELVKDGKFNLPEDSQEIKELKKQGAKWEESSVQSKPAAPTLTPPTLPSKAVDAVVGVPNNPPAPTAKPTPAPVQQKEEFFDPFNNGFS